MKKHLALYAIPSLFAAWAWSAPELPRGCDGVRPMPDCPCSEQLDDSEHDLREALSVPAIEAGHGD